MDPITLGLVCLAIIFLFIVARMMGGRSAPKAGTYDSKRAEGGGSFGGGQSTTDSERVSSGGSFGGATAQRTNDDVHVRGGGSFGGGQRVEDNVRPSRSVLGELERQPGHGGAKVENQIPKGRPAAQGDADSPFPILRNRISGADDSLEDRLSSRLGNRERGSDDVVTRLGNRAAGAVPPQEDEEDDGDSPRVHSGGSFGG